MGFLSEWEPDALKKTIITCRKHEWIKGEELSGQGHNLVLSALPSIIDLPGELAGILISKNKTRFRAVSWCMFPVIWAGDFLKISPIRQEDLSVGDIIVYQCTGRAYAHRLLKTYRRKDKLYIVTGGEKEYENNKCFDYPGVPADNILGKVTGIERGVLRFDPDDVKLSFANLVQGKLRLSAWTLMHKAKKYIAAIFIKLQAIKQYRSFLRRLIKSKVSFFVGAPLTAKTGEINNLCSYRRFDEFCKHSRPGRGFYNISARINNRPIGNISLSLEKKDDRRSSTLSNLVVRIPYRGGGVGYELARKGPRRVEG